MPEIPVPQPKNFGGADVSRRAVQAEALLGHNAPRWLFDLLKGTNTSNNHPGSSGNSNSSQSSQKK